MPCVRHNRRDHRRFLPHFPPGPMRCEFNPELVPPLPHAMMEAFSKSESEPAKRSPLTPNEQLIPKPPGEVSRVGRGGYTLKDILEEEHKWETGLYDKIRERVRSMADKYMDTSLAFPGQDMTKVDLICDMASEEFPVLLNFEGNWVVHDYLRVYLKNRAQKAKKEQQQRDRELEAAAKGKGKGKA